MLTSLALIFLCGLFLGSIFNKLKLPSLVGMLLTGMLLGPYTLNVIDTSVLEISSQLRQFALVIILTRAGLSLNIEDLKKVGRPAILMCFVPACFELIGILVLAPKLLGVSLLEAAVMGTVLAAVSPAVIVPRMLRLMEEGYGTDKSIPQLILAGASVDDVFVIVLFTAFTSLAQGSKVTAMEFLQIPIAIVVGLAIGIIVGVVLKWYFIRFHMRDSVKILILLSISFLMIELEHRLQGVIPMSGLLAIMSIGITLYRVHEPVAKRLSVKYNKLWVGAEVLLFVLVGATVDIKYAFASGVSAILLVVGALLIRMFGVFVCLLKTELNAKERLFCMGAYTPKATVQAAIGGIPLTLGLACGKSVLTVAVLAILVTAPVGAIFIDQGYRRLLQAKSPK